MNPLDELNPPELRNTLTEAWRVVRQRRGWFVASFCLLASAAFVGSLWIPRKYTGSTLFERRNDLVLQSVIGATWDKTFETQRRSLTFDLTGPASLAESLERTSIGRAWPRDENGVLAAAGTAARDMLQNRLADGIEVKMIESTPQRDVVEVRVSDSDAQLASELAASLRESYVERSRKKLRLFLQESLDYFNREYGHGDDQVRRNERRVSELERDYPGLSAEFASRATSEGNQLTTERADLRRKLLELRATEHATMQLAANPAWSAAPASAPVVLRDNPRRTELATEIERVERMMTDERVLRGKTDEHPTLVALRGKLSRLQHDYRSEPERVPAASIPVARAAPPGPLTPAEMLATTQRQIQESETRLAAIQHRLDELEMIRTAALEKRPEYAALNEALRRQQAEMAALQTRIDPIRRILTAQGQDRGVQFVSIREPGSIARPTSPDARAILVACLAIGLAGGAATLVLMEFADRSFRTAAQVTRSLALPVIETIEEIVSPAMRRARLARRFVFAPVTTLFLLCTLTLSGAAAYMSLEAGDRYQQWKRDPLRPQRLFQRATMPLAVQSDEIAPTEQVDRQNEHARTGLAEDTRPTHQPATAQTQFGLAHRPGEEAGQTWDE